MKLLIVKAWIAMFYGSISSCKGAKCNRIPVCITKMSRYSPLRQVYELTRYSTSCCITGLLKSTRHLFFVRKGSLCNFAYWRLSWCSALPNLPRTNNQI